MGMNKLTDIAASLFVTMAGPGLRFVSHAHRHLPGLRGALDRARVQVRGIDYYEPTYPLSHLPAELRNERSLPGVDFNEAGQLGLLGRCRWGDELRAIPRTKPSEAEFGFEQGAFGYGDADMLYNFIRLFRPRRMVEVGSGQSTLMARLAIAANRRDDPGYDCVHVCIEPYEMPWLEATGVQVVRERVEHCPAALFSALGENDILFIDSSHVIRPFGDVLKEFHEIVPSLAPGVIVQVHDIHTPRDYPISWLREDRRLWNEQYLLESFLAFNREFEILAMANWLKHNHFEALAGACGFVREHPECEPGSFWFRRKV